MSQLNCKCFIHRMHTGYSSALKDRSGFYCMIRFCQFCFFVSFVWKCPYICCMKHAGISFVWKCPYTCYMKHAGISFVWKCQYTCCMKHASIKLVFEVKFILECVREIRVISLYSKFQWISLFIPVIKEGRYINKYI